MRSKSAPTLATHAMAYLEIKLYDIIGERYGRQVHEEFTRNWHRFLDDCFLNWNKEIDTPNNILNILNNLWHNFRIPRNPECVSCIRGYWIRVMHSFLNSIY